MPLSAGALRNAAPHNDPASRYAFGFAFVSAAAAMVSIFVSHACLAAAIVLLLFSRTRVRLPPIVWPLAGFVVWTVASAMASGDPVAALPQIKKFYVFAVLVVVFSLFRTMDQARRLTEAWFACALAAALWSIVQFVQKWAAARQEGLDFYNAYVPDRITGFFGHWMTFSQALLVVVLMLASYLLFSASARRAGRGVWLGCGFVCCVALALSFTRSVWVGLAVAGGYLVWNWRRKVLLAVPALVVVALVVAPGAVRRRLTSIVRPDSNQARIVMWRTGVNMIEARPWFGVGPQLVGTRFGEFVPADIQQLPEAYYGHLHNLYVHYAAERGLPAVAFLLWFFVRIIWDHAGALRRGPPSGGGDRRFLLHGAIAATLGVMVVGCFDVTLGDSEVLGIYLAVVALGYRAVAMDREPAAAGLA